MGELLAMGIPVVCNAIGDVKEIIEKTNSGICLEKLNKESFKSTIDKLDSLFNKNAEEIREESKQFFLLENGLKSYSDIYKKVLIDEK